MFLSGEIIGHPGDVIADRLGGRLALFNLGVNTGRHLFWLLQVDLEERLDNPLRFFGHAHDPVVMIHIFRQKVLQFLMSSGDSVAEFYQDRIFSDVG